MKLLKIAAIVALLSGSAFAQNTGPPKNAEGLIFGLVQSFYTNDVDTYFWLTSQFASHERANYTDLKQWMDDRYSPHEVVIETEFGEAPFSIQLMTTSVDKVEIIRVEELKEPGTRLYNVAAWITREHQVLGEPMILREIVVQKLYVVFRDAQPENFTVFETTMDAELLSGWIL